jgi:tetratricopeptide (TPR) repeat protein
MPDQKDRILMYMDKYIGPIPESNRGLAYGQVATALVEANILLEKAEEFANKAFTLAEEQQAKALLQARATNQALIGRIYLNKGKTKEAEKAFQAAYTAVPLADANAPALKMAALGLAELAEKDGKFDKVVEYLSTAAVVGNLDAKGRQKLDTAYRKAHQNSVAGLEEMIDAKYEKVFPDPVKAEPYQPTSARGDHAVLAEVFTGSGCPPCVGADLAFDTFLNRYQRKDVIVMMYHLHIPQPDPMTNPSTQARAKYYNVRGVPTFAIDGDSSMSGGGGRSATKSVYDRLLPVLEKGLEKKAEAQIKLDAVMADSAIKVLANVTTTKSDAKLKLQIALVEEKLRFTGENGIRIHPMVVRSLAGENAGGFALGEKPEAISWRFDLSAISQELLKALDDFEKGREGYTFVEKKHTIDPTNLSVVAFIQDETSKQILQAVTVRVNGAQAASTGTK